jgi:hypothetical protein
MNEIKELKKKFDMINIDGDDELSFEEFNIFLMDILGDVKNINDI